MTLHTSLLVVKNRFPIVYNCLEEGVTYGRQIPVFIIGTYLMGERDVDTNSETSIEGLFAAGECSHTGVHGANRLASNSLLEALVFSRTAANVMTERLRKEHKPLGKQPLKSRLRGQALPYNFRSE